jgi:putative addiction module killer protein
LQNGAKSSTPQHERVSLWAFSGVKGAGESIFELRMDFGPGYRVYFGKDGEDLVILLGGGTKKRQEADIKSARILWQEYKRTKRRGDGAKKEV